jgi:hypothetical protein
MAGRVQSPGGQARQGDDGLWRGLGLLRRRRDAAGRRWLGALPRTQLRARLPPRRMRVPHRRHGDCRGAPGWGVAARDKACLPTLPPSPACAWNYTRPWTGATIASGWPSFICDASASPGRCIRRRMRSGTSTTGCGSSIGSRPIEAPLDLPPMADPVWKLTIDVLSAAMPPALYTDQRLPH